MMACVALESRVDAGAVAFGYLNFTGITGSIVRRLCGVRTRVGFR